MPASASRPARPQDRFERLWWLPPNGRGNGIDDQAWAPVVDVSAGAVTRLLAALRAAGVPAYAASAPGTGARFRLRAPADPRYRIWMGTSAYGRAEQELLTLIPNLPGAHSYAGH